ncbi:response regulator receiver protein [Pseudomonas sp. Leaf48]|jgi:hypothetical protein|uniref:winged helix-turn-helix domain-containing protein n=1 Tax=Pseudomonas sp. Leaf48 TaxID=1736221 RepID=UPI00072C0746|nr:winged helix-turn-helix domain-containing protein [Pseudomonas sp. Leaf48]KQN54694.1 response regulator receiver protein [Pseudomonas sp. Leaf48]
MMLTGNYTSRHHHAQEQTGILTIGPTHLSAENFRELVTSHLGNDLPIDTTCYSNSINEDKPHGLYRAVFIVIDRPQALDQSIALIEGIRSDDLALEIFAVFTGPGTYNKMKYYLAGADHCIKLNATPGENAEVLAELFNSPEWLKENNLLLDPTRMCLVGGYKKLDISFAEMSILEAFALTKNHILSHDEIARVMGLNVNFYDPRALEKSISRLRGKIKGTYGTNAIQSIRGHGYRLIRGLIFTA